MYAVIPIALAGNVFILICGTWWVHRWIFAYQIQVVWRGKARMIDFGLNCLSMQAISVDPRGSASEPSLALIAPSLFKDNYIQFLRLHQDMRLKSNSLGRGVFGRGARPCRHVIVTNFSSPLVIKLGKRILKTRACVCMGE